MTSARFRRLGAAGLSTTLLLAAGCHHSARTASASSQAPERPDWASGYPRREPSRSGEQARREAPRTERAPEAAALPPDIHGRPTLVETGMASWYGPQYNKHKAADGTTYDQNALTGAHRTLPLGSMVRVTNLTTGESVVVRITDRGPFVTGRVLDVSLGAAKAIGLYRLGVAKVKIEAYAPPTASPTGIWCVQTGAFGTAQDADDLRAALVKRYATAKVQEFQGPTGYWVRIDPAGRGKQQALAMQDWIGKPDDKTNSFLVRLD